nr:venom factor-like isoform X1 [Pelodiscus sinensis]XP_025036196.1 venom factor-like isoform X1 [Pelodiscus sinensis]|eukprot:XP_014424811.1 venom factor-like isoform X1 [Pelodiscus sinensis]
MEGFVLCLGILFVFSFPEVSHSQLYTLITPNVLRVESEEKIVVEAHGLTTPSEVTITIYNFPQKRNYLYQVKTSLNSENGMMGTAVIKVPAKDMKVNSKQNQYVFVEAKFPQQKLEKIVLVSFHSGYIFIQTDKTTYTPGSSVLFRIFTIGHKLEPLHKNLITQLVTPEGSMVQQNLISFFMSSITSQSFNLPEENNLGTWKIVAWYNDTPQKNFSAQFEVKEYVLPSFAVTLEPSEKFVCINDNKDLKVSINARALNGKELYGTAFVLFGVKVDDRKKSISQSLKRVLIIDGAGEAVLTKAMLQAQFPNLSELIGHSIYISVTVLTDSGTETVEETNINIVASPPYEIHFTNTPKYFKPGVPFDLMVSVTNPDGSPAAQVPLTVKVRGLQDATLIHTLADGTAKWNVNPAADATQLPISVKTALANLPENQQVSKSMVAKAYQTQEGSKNYLHLLVSTTQVKPRDKLLVSFHLKTGSPDGLNQIQYITYLILTKGTIIHAGRLARQVGKTVVTMSLSITPNLMPSFRIVGYYHIRQKEIVADSVWVDVQGTCMGTLVIKEATNVGNRNSEPGHMVKIKVEGDATAHIALAAVDKAVNLLNKKHMITQTKIWDAVENSDIGCTAGSGKNILGVFADAGLALVTNVKISTPTRTDPQCPQPAVRRHRSVQLSKTKQVAWYQNEQLRRCCEDGTYENPMGHSCEKRAQNIQEEECKKIFLTCCQMTQEKHQKHHLETSSDFIDDDDFLPNDEIATRSIFPESWLWQIEQMTKPPNQEGNFPKTIHIFLKDSITTWQVRAVSVSETTGICVADPYEITVLKKFTIDLRLPYSVVRNEPVEIQAIFYSYLEQDIKVRMELMYNPAFCSPSSSKANYRQIFNLKARSSRALPFVIVPLQLGFHNLEISAAVWHSNEADHVKKKLKVVPEGRKETKTIASMLLDPARKGINGVQEVMVGAADIDDMVPNTESQTRIIFQGKPVLYLTEEPFDGTRLNQFILKPHGNGEVNMKNMSTTVIATLYLDHTEQWEKIGMDLRVEARNLILQGYMQQLVFKKPDHSYAAFQDKPSSTWLTAYVTKVFAMASHLVPIPSEVICNAGHWLSLEKHNSDGTFKEDSPVIQKEMVGGYQGAEPEVSLTAFVLIAMLESKDICQNLFVRFHKSILVAGEYLSSRYSSLTRPYTVAITSYALALMGKLPDAKELMAASKDGNRWEEQDNSNFNTESTSYALLALLRLKRFDLVGPVVRWLKQQAYYVESYDSIATTVMLQALGQYHIDVPLHEDLMLDVSFLLPRRAKKLTYRIAYTNAHLTRKVETKFNENFTITAEGYGQVTLTAVTDYNARIREDESQCKTFDLSVSVQEAQGAKKADGTLRSIGFEICTRFLGAVNATMSVLRVSMLKGFLPDTEDLTRLSQGVDRYVSWYEIDTTLSDQVSLIIYLDTVSHVESSCLRFKAHQFLEVGLVKPLSVTVYEYYATDARCTKFYQLPKQSSLLSSFSHKEVHQCSEENCSKQGQLNGSVTQEMRIQEACKPGVDYVYKARLIKTEESSSYDKYTMEILETIKAGTDENPEGKTRVFISHANCRQVLKQELNNDYLIWGLSSDLWTSGANIFYVIGKDTWMEKLPSESKCQQADFKNLCIEFVEFSHTIMVFGCPA